MIIYIYILPRAGADNPLGSIFFSHKYKSSVHLHTPSKFPPFNYILLIFPIQMHGRPKLTLPQNRSKSYQGHVIYINFVKLHCLMLHAKFQNHRPSGSGEEDFLKVFDIYSHGGHLGHVTLTIYTNFHSLLTMLHIKFGFNWPSGFREDH